MGSSSRFLDKYYVINSLVFVAYAVIRFFADATKLREIDIWMGLPTEYNILAMTAMFLVSKYRKAVSMEEFVQKALLYLKTSVLMLLSYIDMRLMAWFVVMYLVMFLMLSPPAYNGADETIQLNPTSLEHRILGKDTKEKKVAWLVYFYADWCDKCAHTDPIFSEISVEYSSMRLKFGRVDVSRYPELASKFGIDTGVRTRQLPTVILFSHGKESSRLPVVQTNGTVLNTALDKAGLIKYFQLAKRKEKGGKGQTEAGPLTADGDREAASPAADVSLDSTSTASSGPAKKRKGAAKKAKQQQANE